MSNTKNRKPVYCLGLSTMRKVAKFGQLQTEAVDFIAADDLFHNKKVLSLPLSRQEKSARKDTRPQKGDR